MSFKKYISKISNTIGTVNYLQQKSRKPRPSQSRRSSKNHQLLYDDGYDVADIDPNTINKMDIDLSINGSRKGSLSDDYHSSDTQIILSAAVAKLRSTLFHHSLVFYLAFVFVFFSLPFASFVFSQFYQHHFISHSVSIYTKHKEQYSFFVIHPNGCAIEEEEEEKMFEVRKRDQIKELFHYLLIVDCCKQEAKNIKISMALLTNEWTKQHKFLFCISSFNLEIHQNKFRMKLRILRCLFFASIS